MSGCVGAERPENQLFAKPRVLQSVFTPPRALPSRGGLKPLRKTRVLQIVGWSRLAPQVAKRAHTGLRPPILGAAAPQLSCPPSGSVASGPLRRPRISRAGGCTARSRSRTGAAAGTRGRLPGRERQSAARPGSGCSWFPPPGVFGPRKRRPVCQPPLSAESGRVTAAHPPAACSRSQPLYERRRFQGMRRLDPTNRHLEEFRRPPGGGQ